MSINVTLFISSHGELSQTHSIIDTKHNQDEQLRGILEHHHVSKLFLLDLKGLTDTSCLYISQNCRYLREFSIGASNITAVGLLCLASHCKNLQYLSLEQDSSTSLPISEEAMSCLLTQHRNLKIFHISQIDRITKPINFNRITTPYNFFCFTIVCSEQRFKQHTPESPQQCMGFLRQLLKNMDMQTNGFDEGNIVFKPRKGGDEFLVLDPYDNSMDIKKNHFMIKMSKGSGLTPVSSFLIQ
jgi:hypothetical protein